MSAIRGVRCLPIAEWPELDRLLWLAAIAPTDPFAESGGTRARQRPISNRNIARGHGRWLTFLSERDPAFGAEHPADRFAPDVVIAYIEDLVRHGNRKSTLVVRLEELREAAKVMDPDRDWSFIGRLAAKILARRDIHPSTPHLFQFISTVRLLEFGLGLMDRAEKMNVRRLSAVLYRDGLMIALLALRPLRRRNLTELTIGGDLFGNGLAWSINIPAAASKTHQPLLYQWPQELVEPLNRYLSIYRQLLAARSGRWRRDIGQRLWISSDGSPMTQDAIADRLRFQTQKHFGFTISPHKFRHAAATTLAVYASAHVREAAPLLGHRDPRTTEQYYNLAGSLEAHRKFGAELDGLRARATRAISARNCRKRC